MEAEGIVIEYCAVCERETSHRKVDDDVYFEKGLECLTCHTVWEADDFED